jgi:hypothetical protein
VIYNVHFKWDDSAVGIATDYGLDDQMIEIRIPAAAGNFSLRPSLLFKGYQGFFPWGEGKVGGA